MERSHSYTDDKSGFMKRLAECPICFEIPLDGVMLQCRNGHNICATCKNQLDTNNAKYNNAKCPQGHCDYDNPPRRNRTVADIVDKMFVACKYSSARDANHSSCRFKGAREDVQRHENLCEHRSVPCPNSGCNELVSVARLIGHLSTAHRCGPTEATLNLRIEVWFDWRNVLRETKEISTPRTMGASSLIASFKCSRGLLYIWLQIFDLESVTERIMCRVTVAGDASWSFCAPVYPIDWTDRQIMAHDNCVRLSTWSMRKKRVLDISGDVDREGFEVAFDILARRR